MMGRPVQPQLSGVLGQLASEIKEATSELKYYRTLAHFWMAVSGFLLTLLIVMAWGAWPG